MTRPQRNLTEVTHTGSVEALSGNRNGNSLDKPDPDYVRVHEEWRKRCPNYDKSGHAAFCPRCDNSWPVFTGGADVLRRRDWVTEFPYEKFPEPLKPREVSKVSPALWESLGPFIQRVPLAPKNPGAKIEELTEVTAQEQNPMADNEATRALFRELLGMTGGANASGRGTLHIPDEIMDSMAGDAAQDDLARERLIMEMRNRESRQHDPRFVALDLMEMEANHVDDFLKAARKKIIKRSKPTRKVCCTRIGGILDQMMGTAGGEHADAAEVSDRGKFDPIGDADEVEKAHKVAEDEEVLRFIAEEFSPFEHDDDCVFADPKFSLDEGEERYFQPPKRRGLLREHFGLTEGAGIPVDKAKAALAMLRKKKAAGELAGKEAALLPRLEQYVKMGGKGEDKNQQQEEDVTMEPSRTANALSSFLESSGEVNRYKAADAGSGKGSPDSGMMSKGDAGQLNLKTRDDNKQYPTELTPAEGGNKSKTSGEPQSLSTRGKDRGDPIGEDEETQRISETANALANFMEANQQYAEAKKRLKGYGDDAGDLDLNKRPEQKLGGPLKPAKGEYPKDDEKPRYEKGADPRGDAHDKGAGKN